MIERIIIIDSVDPVSFYGINNCNMQLIRNLFPKLRMAARGQVIKVIGDPEETAVFEKKIKELEAYCAKYNKLPEDVILDVIHGDTPKEMKQDNVVTVSYTHLDVYKRQRRLGIEKIMLKMGQMYMYFVDDSNQAYYRSPMFGRILNYMQAHPRRCRIREKNGRRSIVISDVPTVEEAVALLQEILNLTSI